MMANNHMYAIDRSDEYLAHYGIKGMKWGVRKALESGNDRALARQYRKASRKLAKLQKQATSGKKYARRAALLGAGAAAAGGLAAAGVPGVSNAIRTVGTSAATGANALGKTLSASKNARLRAAGSALQRGAAGLAVGAGKAGVGLEKWGNQTGARLANAQSQKLANRAAAWRELGVRNMNTGNGVTAARQLQKASKYSKQADAAKTAVSNNTLARVGAGALGAGLAVGAGYNAYRAATTKKAAKRAAEFQREMNQAFKGTKYANGGNGSSSGNKKRRRR